MEKLILPATSDNLSAMIDFIIAAARRLKFADKGIFEIQLAAEEVLVNIINYAYPSKPGNIEIEVDSTDDFLLRVKVIDQGKPFNPLEMMEPDTNLPLEKRKIGGLGIFLVRKIMDTVTYEFKDGKNILSFTKSKK